MDFPPLGLPGNIEERQKGYRARQYLINTDAGTRYLVHGPTRAELSQAESELSEFNAAATAAHEPPPNARFNHGVVAALAASEAAMSISAFTDSGRGEAGSKPLPDDVVANRGQSWPAQAAEPHGAWGARSNEEEDGDNGAGAGSENVSNADAGGPSPKGIERSAVSARPHGSSNLLTPTADPALLSALHLIQAHKQAVAQSHDGASVASEASGGRGSSTAAANAFSTTEPSL